MTTILRGSIVGAVAGFFTRPCCALPAALSLAGVSGTGFAQTAAAYRPAFLSVSAVMLVAALWTTFRRDGGSVNKVLAVCATLLSFALSLRWLEVF